MQRDQPASPPEVAEDQDEADLFWDDEPATEKQLAYIHRLGGRAGPGLTKGDASREIEELICQRDDALHLVANHFEREHDIDIPEDKLKAVYALAGPRAKRESEAAYVRRFAAHIEFQVKDGPTAVPDDRREVSGAVRSVLLVLFGAAALVALFALTGCAGLPGNVATSSSEFDQSTQVTVEPGWLHGGGLKTAPLKVGGFWSDQAPGQFQLEVVSLDSPLIERLKVRLDDQRFEFAPARQMADISAEPVYGGAQSSKVFVVPLDFVRQMVTAREAIIRVEFPGSFAEGRFAFDQQTYARPAFRKALAEIDRRTAARD
jgi:hypothetical protein